MTDTTYTDKVVSFAKYEHDATKKKYFQKTTRNYQHGCCH